MIIWSKKSFLQTTLPSRKCQKKRQLKHFQDDGYFDYQKRNMRYGKFLSRDSIWANSPAKMFVGFFNETPVAVVGFSRYKGFLLDAGVHVREGYREEKD